MTEFECAYKLQKDLPFLKKGSIYQFDTVMGYVYWKDGKEWVDTPLRDGLAGYLWLLKTEKGYFRKVKS